MDKYCPLKVALLGSGTGTSIASVCNACKYNLLPVKINCIVTNNQNDYTLENIASHFDKKYVNLHWDKDGVTREEYERTLIDTLEECDVDLVVLAGWNHIVGKELIGSFRYVINMHPALPDSFVGQNCIKEAYNAYQRGEIKYTGSMVHHVTTKLDRGEVISSVNVPIYGNDTYEMLETRQKLMEKGLLVESIQKIVAKYNASMIEDLNSGVYIGKVRRVEDIGYNLLLMSTSDRLSAFDKHVCNVPLKGLILNQLSKWWFSKTTDIIPNHYLFSNNNHMVVKKTKPIMLEIVVRGYMTGSSNTSIWSMYKRGERQMYGLQFRDGYVKNEKLDEIIITPTTKGEHDYPITEEEIVSQKFLTQEEYDFVKTKALELFKRGQEVASESGFILVDTKYEFGRLENDEIILIDELHTCDSSRYWLKETYEDNFKNGKEPNKLDKDCIRDWIKTQCDPYNEEVPTVPENVIQNVSNVYKTYYENLTGETLENGVVEELTREDFLEDYFKKHHDKLVVILSGSPSDKPHALKIKKCLADLNIASVEHYKSAHKNTEEVLYTIKSYNKRNLKTLYVTIAGLSNALSGVTACNTHFPVIACPPHKDNMDMTVNINSTIQCPSKVPVMTILKPGNVAISVDRIFRL